MGYDLSPRNDDAGGFHFGAFSFPILLEACGYLFPCVHNGGRWFCAFGVDKRMPKTDDYPRLLSNDGFAVTAEEARIMARVARNFVAIQRLLPEEDRDTQSLAGKAEFTRADLEAALVAGLTGTDTKPWPVKIRDDFTAKFEAFAEWAEKSGGFRIY